MNFRKALIKSLETGKKVRPKDPKHTHLWCKVSHYWDQLTITGPIVAEEDPKEAMQGDWEVEDAPN